MFSKNVIKRKKGWAYHLITEDLEFTIDSILYGFKIGYCGSAILYDDLSCSISTHTGPNAVGFGISRIYKK